MLDLVIVGSGPAGMAAAIYAARADLDFIVLEKDMSGGQVLNTSEVDNYPGFSNVSGMELAEAMRKHCDALGVRFETKEATALESQFETKEATALESQFETKEATTPVGAGANGHAWKISVEGEEAIVTRTVIVATGATPSPPFIFIQISIQHSVFISLRR